MTLLEAIDAQTSIHEILANLHPASEASSRRFLENELVNVNDRIMELLFDTHHENV